MSFEFPFSKPAGWPVQKIVLLGLIAVHTVWICIHLSLVSRELVNPWKAGGYGMYTTVHPSAQIHLFDARFDGFQISMDPKDRKSFLRANQYFIFRCNPLSLASVKMFLENNPNHRGTPLRFIITERKFLRDPIRTERLPHAILEIRWTGQSTFDYAGKVCGKLFRGEAELTS